MLPALSERSRFGRASATLRLAAAALALVAVSVPGARALTDEEVFRNLDLSTTQPSARALGMGGAFIALADDPSAAYYNPAGLGFLDRPQMMAEVRGFQHDDAEQSLPGFYTEALVHQSATGHVLLEDEDVVAPTYLSYVHPITRRFVIGVSRHERVNLERDSFTGFPNTAVTGALSTIGHLDILQDDFSITFAGLPHESFAMGLTVGVSRLDVVQTVDNYVMTQGLRAFDYRTQVDDDDTTFSFTFGLLWKPHDKIAVGMVYRDGPEFDLVEQVLQDGIRATDARSFLFASGVGNTVGEFINSFVFPDSYGIGFSFGPFFEPSGGGGFTVNFDAVEVQYNDLIDNYVAGLNNQIFGAEAVKQAFDVENGTEFHLGLGWSWTVGYNNMVHLRVGGYTREDPAIVSSGRLVATADGTTPAGYLLPREGDGDTDVHLTLGAGFTLRRGFYAFELNGAVDFSDIGEEYVGSAIFRF